MIFILEVLKIRSFRYIIHETANSIKYIRVNYILVRIFFKYYYIIYIYYVILP